MGFRGFEIECKMVLFLWKVSPAYLGVSKILHVPPSPKLKTAKLVSLSFFLFFLLLWLILANSLMASLSKGLMLWEGLEVLI